MQTDDGRRGFGNARGSRSWEWFAALAVVAGLLLLGVANVAVRATWHELEDGVLWVSRPQGVTAGELSRGSSAARAGVRAGDVLMAIDGEPVESPADVVALAHGADDQHRFVYTLLRLGTRELAQVQLAPSAPGQQRALFRARRGRHLHPAGRRDGAPAPPGRPVLPALLLAHRRLLRCVHLLVRGPLRHSRLDFLLGRLCGHARAGAAAAPLHAGVP